MARAAASSDIYNAVAEPRRRAILGFLAESETGERPVNELVTGLRMPQPAVSKHLKVLRQAGLVSVRRSGRRQLYRVNADRLKPMHDWTKTFERFWEHQLDRIQAQAERVAAGLPEEESTTTHKGEDSHGDRSE